MKIRFALVILIFSTTLAGSAAAQYQPPPSAEPPQSALRANAPLTPQDAAQPPANQTPSGIDRWLDVQTLTIAARYRSVEDSTGSWPVSHVQASGLFRIRFKVDPAARLSATAAIATGNGFTSGWNNTGIGTGSIASTVSAKQIYVTAVPVRGVELSTGSQGFARGEATEITTYDNDGYLVGERLVVKRPQWVYVDEVVATYAYVGDLAEPSAFRRLDRLRTVNYRQLQATKKLARVASLSADYTRAFAQSVMRVAVTVRTPSTHVVDLVRLEAYRRIGSTAANGFAVFVERRLKDRLTAGGGYADIDRRYGGLNADRFNVGRRLFLSGAVKVAPDVAASLFAGRAINNAFAVSNRTRVELIVSWNALATAQRAGLVR